MRILDERDMCALPDHISGIARLFSTDPPVAERVRRLLEMAGRTSG